MSVMHRFALYALASISFAAPALAAASNSSVSSPAFTKCGGSLEEWDKDLKRLEQQLEAWTKAAKPATLKSSDLGKTREGKLVQLYASHLLPTDSPFPTLYQDCWVNFVEFEEAVETKNKLEADRSLGVWEKCVRAIQTQFPKEAEELLICWNKKRDTK